jgi:hypothetical protein
VKKLDLIRDHCLVGRPVVDVEMIDTWIDAEFTFRGLARSLNCRSRLGNLILRSDTNQPGTMKRDGMPDRTVGRTQQPGRRDPIPPSRFLTDGDHAPPTDLCAGRADQRPPHRVDQRPPNSDLRWLQPSFPPRRAAASLSTGFWLEARPQSALHHVSLRRATCLVGRISRTLFCVNCF